MKLSIRNLAKIEQADIELNGLTVITGDNDTGKSTLGKALYAMFNGFRDMASTVHGQRCHSLANAVISEVISDEQFPLKTSLLGSFDEIVDLAKILRQKHDLSVDYVIEQSRKYLVDKFGLSFLVNKERESEFVQRLENILQITDSEITRQQVENVYKQVFQSQINSLQTDAPAEIQMQIKQQNVEAVFKNNSCCKAEIRFNLTHSAVYIDNPFVVDQLSSHFFRFNTGLMVDLENRLRRQKAVDTVTNIVNEKALKNVMDIVEKAVPGEFVWLERQLLLKRIGWSEPLNVRNLSTGVKAFAILKLLIQNHQLQEKDVLILDEPEIHLHPAWQLKYAEFLVLFQKVFDLTILLTTHSPYFLNAIEVYSRKHESLDRVNYYQTELTNDGRACLTDVTNTPESIYERMAKPIIEMRKLRDDLDKGDGEI